MSGWIFGSKNTHAVPRYTGLSVQTSALDKAIPIGWGRYRVAPNIVWWNNFKQHKHKVGKGGAVGGKGGESITYSTGVILALVEGPIQSIPTVYQNQSVTTPAALGLTVFTGTAGQTAPGFITTNYPAEALSYARTAYLFSSAYDLGSSPTLPMNAVEIIGTYSGSMPGTVDANPADIINDLLTNPQYGMGLTSGNIDATGLAFYKTYCQAQGLFMSPVLEGQEKVTAILDRWAMLTNSWIYWSGDVIKFVPLGDSVVTGHSATYTPANPIRYQLTPDNMTSDPPIKVHRKDPADCFNRTVLEIQNRDANPASPTTQYSALPCEYKDQTLIDQFGLRDNASTSAHDVKDPAIGLVMATLIGKRAAFLRNTYEFQTTYNYVLLEPGDIVGLTDPNNSAITQLTVRIVDVEEDEAETLKFTAEEFTGVVGTVSTPSADNNTPVNFNRLVAPGNVNDPAIFEPNSALTAGQAQIWMAVSGGANWGGADAYVSADGGTTYVFVGQISAAAKQGLLTGTLASHADPDTVNTLAVDLTESQGVLAPATHADADALRTLSLIQPASIAGAIQTTGAELVSYGNVASTGTYTDNLTYLRRGKYGTAPSSHASGQNFTLLDITGADGTTIVHQLPAAYIGTTLHIKFVSYNQYGQAQQSLASVTDYTYTPTGAGYGSGPGGVPGVPTGLALATGTGQNILTWNLNPSTDNVTQYKLYAAPGLGQSFGSSTLIWSGLGTTYVHSGLASAAQYTYFLVATNIVGDSSPTSGVDGTSGVITFALQIRGGTPGRMPLDAEELFNVSMEAGDKFASGLPGSILQCEVAPTSTYTITLKKNGSTIGTGTINAGATVGSWTFSSTVTFAGSDLFTATSIHPQDATASGISYTLIGTRTS